MTATTPELRPDDFRPYTLPDSVETTIPARTVPGEPGIHWVARGLMAETCAQLLGRPISLDLHDQPNSVFIYALISLSSTVLSAEPLDDLTTVQLVVAKQDSRWALLGDNRLLGLGINVPSPAHLASLVAADHRRRRTRPAADRSPGPHTSGEVPLGVAGQHRRPRPGPEQPWSPCAGVAGGGGGGPVACGGVSGTPRGQHTGVGSAAMNPAPPVRVRQPRCARSLRDPTRTGDPGTPAVRAGPHTGALRRGRAPPTPPPRRPP